MIGLFVRTSKNYTIIYINLKHMNIKLLKTSILTFGILAISVVSIKSKVNGLSSAYSGAPSESNCSSCHSSYSVQTSGTNYDKISLKGNFTGNGYIPDSTYKITVTYKETGKTVFGFQVTALQDQNVSYPTPAGTFNNTDSRTRAFSQTSGSTTRYYIEHTSTGSTKVATDSVSWVFEWKAPSSNMGDIKMHLVLNVTNANGFDNGDYIYTKKFVISPSTLLTKAKASIADSLYCSGKTLTFNGTGTNNPTGYSWSFPGGSITSSTLQNPTVSYSTTGAKIAVLYTYNSKGKSLADTLKFNVIQGATNPVVTPSSAAVSICSGDSMLFSVKSVTGNSYQWSPNGLKSNSFYAKTAGSYFVTAKYSNGCTRVSTTTVVTLLTKPAFNTTYSLQTDSNCISEKLNLTLRNTNGYSDSFSYSLKNGPYVKDSLKTITLKIGTNNVNIWAKSKNGCISSVQAKKFIGIDSQSGPNITIINKTTNGFTFHWDTVPYATEYFISLDSGKTWKTPTLGKLSNNENATVPTAGSKKSMFIYAITSKFCGITKISSAVGQALGCNDVAFSLTNSKIKPCLNETNKLIINGLWNYNKYNILINNQKSTDTVYTYSLNKAQIFSVDIIDSANLICGYTNKTITVNIDSGMNLSSNLDNIKTIVVCNSPKTYLLNVNLKSINKGDSLFYSLNGNTKFASITNNFNIPLAKGDSFYIIGKNNNKCKTETTIIHSDLRKPLDASFTNTYLSGFNYKFTPTDTLHFHNWKIIDNGNEADSSNLVKFAYDFSAFSQKNLKIFHTLSDKTIKSGQQICFAYDSTTFDVLNYSSVQTLNKDQIRFRPNPLKPGGYIHFDLTENMLNATYNLYSIQGEFVQNIKLDHLMNWKVPQTISAGNYIISIEINNRKSSKLLIIQ